jgi:hypothetical protein
LAAQSGAAGMLLFAGEGPSMDLFVVLFFLLFTFFLSSGSLGKNEGEVSGKVSKKAGLCLER